MPIPPRTLIRLLHDNDRFRLLTHVAPDGDAAGSLFGLGWILRAMGKQVELVLPTDLPHGFEWLSPPFSLVREAFPLRDEWTVLLDCGNPDRVGEPDFSRLLPERSLIIDHHQANPGINPMDWIDPSASSTGEMLAVLARALEIPLQGEIARSLYAAMASDTGYFTYANTRPSTLNIVAEMMEQGLEAAVLNQRMRNTWSLSRLRLQGLAAGGASLVENGRICLLCVTREMFDRAQAGPGETDELVNLGMRVRGVRISVLLRQESSREVKFSLRSTGRVDVAAAARTLGGGGHVNASGGTVSADLDQARESVLRVCVEALRKEPDA